MILLYCYLLSIISSWAGMYVLYKITYKVVDISDKFDITFMSLLPYINIMLLFVIYWDTHIRKDIRGNK